MDLCRSILFKIEEEFESTAIYNLVVEGYTRNQIAYHCGLLHEAGLISDYKAQYADNKLYSFYVSSLTWEGHDFLDKIREDTIWKKIKETIKSKALPMTLDVIKTVAVKILKTTLEAIL